MITLVAYLLCVAAIVSAAWDYREAIKGWLGL